MPMHIHDVGGRLSRSVNISEKGWHVAHVFDVKDGDTRYEHWDSQNLIRRFIRTVHPCNFFYMPNLKGLPYGGRDDERAFYYDVLSKRHAGVWQEFSTLAGAAPRAHSCHASARITYDVASPTRFNSRNTINYKKLTRIPDDAVITVVNATLSGVGNDPTSTKAQQFAPIAANSGSTMMVIRKAGSREDYVRWFFAQGNLTIDDMTAANWPLRQ
jgi:hypothetical protein